MRDFCDFDALGPVWNQDPTIPLILRSSLLGTSAGDSSEEPHEVAQEL